MKKPNIPLNCHFKASYVKELEDFIRVCKVKCHKYNSICPSDTDALDKLIREIVGALGENSMFIPPFWCDYGYNISVGDNFYSNHNLVVNDGAKVTFGNNVFIAPNCCFTTAEHAIDPDLRRAGYEIAMPITVGNNVWIGTGSSVLAGVTIGDNSVIGAGSVVTHDIPAGVVAVGVPCKVLRKITEKDKERYPMFD